ncbi:hypothetical protein MLD38_015268 [Melastoma candidum]|uniref:Uncharacterized protein n=1 Tax=Melastoma candidum TaxID=119954 RepID=A0ACB9RHF6_9MYRT|nr:hypothetical protein MLD38_015268 [Melastoma candidum]
MNPPPPPPSSSSSSSSSTDIYHQNTNPNWLSFSISHHSQPPILPFPLFHPSPLLSPPPYPSTDEDPSPPPLVIPKLADFLGVTPLSSGFPPPHVEDDSSPAVGGIYDSSSDLKTIASSFLRGFSRDQQLHHPPQELQLVGSDRVPQQQVGKKAIDTFGQRTSIYRGVTRHRWTGRYEAHLWDNSCRREGQSRKGRQGGYDQEDKAARAYDLAALKYWGPTTTTNFPVCNYEREVEEMKHMSKQEFVASLRRKSSGFSRGASIYRGVTRHHQHGRWQARIGRVAGNKDLYLGTFSTQEEAAEAYDIAAIKFRGLNAVTNFDMSRYDVKSIMSSNLPIGGMSGKSRTSPESTNCDNGRSMGGSGNRLDDRDGLSSATSLSFATHHQHNQRPHNPSSSTQLCFAIPIKADPSDSWLAGYNHQNPGGGPFPHSSVYGTQQLHHPNSFDYQGDAYVQQQQCDGVGVSLPYATVTTNADSNGSSRGSWMMMGPSSPPQNIHTFQTPLYGME